MTILAMVNAEKEGQIESKMMKARQLEEIREARKKEIEKRQSDKKSKLVSSIYRFLSLYLVGWLTSTRKRLKSRFGINENIKMVVTLSLRRLRRKSPSGKAFLLLDCAYSCLCIPRCWALVYGLSIDLTASDKHDEFRKLFLTVISPSSWRAFVASGRSPASATYQRLCLVLDDWLFAPEARWVSRRRTASASRLPWPFCSRSWSPIN